MTSAEQHVVVLGASPKRERYSNRAVRMLAEYGHRVTPVNPGVGVIEGLDVAHRLSDVAERPDTLTMYVGARISSEMEEEIVRLDPRRVIFNPGAENPALRRALEEQGIKTLEACTLVLLRTGQF